MGQSIKCFKLEDPSCVCTDYAFREAVVRSVLQLPMPKTSLSTL